MKNCIYIVFISICLHISNFAHAESLENLGVGIGSGIYYGHAFPVGVHARYTIKETEIIGAIGQKEHWGLGVRYSLFGDTNFFQPRMGLLYGTNGDLRPRMRDDLLREAGFPETYNGLTLVLGSRLSFGEKHMFAFAMDLGYRVTDGGFSDDEARARSVSPHESLGQHGEELLYNLMGPLAGSYDWQVSLGFEFDFW